MAALAAVGRQEELLAQLRALLFSPYSSPAPAATPPAAAPAVKVESATSAGGTASSVTAGGRRRRRRRQGSKRDRVGDDDDDRSKAKDELEEPADAHQPHYSPPPCCKRRKKKQQSSKSIVTSVPDFDGYQWRKYGQKQIEGAMYPRSYYRCTLSAEQGCQAKRTVQRNDDDGDAATTTAEYTVVYMAEHTCTATDSLEAPVILETTAITVVPSSAATKIHTGSIAAPATSAGSCSAVAAVSTSITTGRTESPAISVDDDITCWSSSSGASSDDYYNSTADDDYYCGRLFAAVVHGDGGGWAIGPAADSATSLEDLTGPIRSPVHVPAAAAGWTIDELLLQILNEPVCHFI